MTNRNETERQILDLLATERIYRPIASISGKLDRKRPKLAKAIDLNGKKSFNGERAYVRVNEAPGTKARGLKEGVEKFCAEFPKYGETLTGYIAEERAIRETNMHFGMYERKRYKNLTKKRKKDPYKVEFTRMLLSISPFLFAMFLLTCINSGYNLSDVASLNPILVITPI